MKETPSKSVTKKNKVVKSGVTSTKKPTRPSSTAKKAVKGGVTSKKPTKRPSSTAKKAVKGGVTSKKPMRPSSTAKKAVKRRVTSKKSTIPSSIAKKAVKKGSGVKGTGEIDRNTNIAKTGERGPNQHKQNIILRNIPYTKWKRKHQQDEDGIAVFKKKALEDKQELVRNGVNAFAPNFKIVEYREKKKAEDEEKAAAAKKADEEKAAAAKKADEDKKQGSMTAATSASASSGQPMSRQVPQYQQPPYMRTIPQIHGQAPHPYNSIYNNTSYIPPGMGGKSRSQKRRHNNAKKRKTRS